MTKYKLEIKNGNKIKFIEMTKILTAKETADSFRAILGIDSIKLWYSDSQEDSSGDWHLWKYDDKGILDVSKNTILNLSMKEFHSSGINIDDVQEAKQAKTELFMEIVNYVCDNIKSSMSSLVEENGDDIAKMDEEMMLVTISNLIVKSMNPTTDIDNIRKNNEEPVTERLARSARAVITPDESKYEFDYQIGLRCGGLQGDPEFRMEYVRLVKAKNLKEAKDKWAQETGEDKKETWDKENQTVWGWQIKVTASNDPFLKPEDYFEEHVRGLIFNDGRYAKDPSISLRNPCLGIKPRILK